MISRHKGRFCPIAKTGAWVLSALLAGSGPNLIYADEPHPSRAVAPGEGASDVDLKRWIEELGSAIAAEREGAVRSLIAAGPRAMPAVRPALESNDREVRSRAEAVAQALELKAAKYFEHKRGRDIDAKYQGPIGVHSAYFGGTTLGVEDMQYLACLYRLETLHIQDCATNDKAFQYVGQLRSLKKLRVYSGNSTGRATGSMDITDEGLEHLAPLDKLTSFSLSRVRIRGSGLAALAQIPSISFIAVSGCPGLDESLAEGLEAFRSHKALSHLDVSFCRLPENAPQAISHIRNLESVSLEGTTITNDGLKPLSALPRLQRLNLGYTLISDAGVEYLARCPRLERLEAQRTQITDAGVRHFAKYPRLEYLNLSWTKVTPSGLRALRDLDTLGGVTVDGIRAKPIEIETLRRSLQSSPSGASVGSDPERSRPPSLPKWAIEAGAPNRF